jgi:hypothetical protein
MASFLSERDQSLGSAKVGIVLFSDSTIVAGATSVSGFEQAVSKTPTTRQTNKSSFIYDPQRFSNNGKASTYTVTKQ